MRYRRWLIALAAGAALVVGCGDDEDGSSEAAAEGGAAAAAPQCNGEQIRFQLSFFPNGQHAGYLVAETRDFYEEAGVKVETIPGGPTVNPSLQAAQGNVDIALMDFSEALNAMANGAPLVWIAQTYQSDPIRYISLKDKHPLPDPSALKGTIVGTQQVGELEPELQGMLEQAGLTIDDVTIKSIDPSVTELLAGRIDVFPLQTFFHISQLDESDIKYPEDVDVLDPNELGVAVAANGMAVNREFYESNKDAVACFIAGAIKGWETTIDDPAAVVPDVIELQQEGLATEKATEVNVEQTVDLVVKSADGADVEPLTLDMDYLQQSADRLKEAGIVKDVPDLAEVVDPEPLERARALAGP
jgi:NitT/TauT family transport system substrate-binding protein